MDDVSLFSTKILASVLSAREKADKAYQRFADCTLYWAFIDLAKSSNYRITHGSREGYVRGETFFTLVRETIAPTGEVRLVKEIGDSVLLCAPSFRPIFEVLLLVDETSRMLCTQSDSTEYPFGVRSAIGWGVAKRLMRQQEDFLGIPIDRLSRLMSVRSKNTNIILDEAACQSDVEETVAEYAPSVWIGTPIQFHSESGKELTTPLFYRELFVDSAALRGFKDYFTPWRA